MVTLEVKVLLEADHHVLHYWQQCAHLMLRLDLNALPLCKQLT